MTKSDRYVIPGSARVHADGAAELGNAHPEERAEVTISVRAKKAIDPTKIISRAELEAEHGADPGDIEKVVAFAGDHDLKIVDTDAGRRRVVVSGKVADLEKAFGVTLKRVAHAGGEYRGRTGEISVPGDLAGIVDGVFNLDNRPQAKPRLRPLAAAPISYRPQDVGKAYQFPTGSLGHGQTVAILELGGGYRPADLTAYFQKMGVAPAPQVISVSVDGAQNNANGGDADGEVMLDIEVVGAVAPGARIVVYFAPNTDAGFLDAITKAAHDKVYNPTIMSISWGGPESSWTQQAMTRFDAAFQAAAAVGMTVFVAAGDDGSSDGVTDGHAHADFPASSPNVVACGGTSLQIKNGQINSEVVWNNGSQGGATGGGVSGFFKLPGYQSSAHVPPSVNPGHFVGRGLPDVAGDADPQTGYIVRVDGQDTVIGGTSAVAPLWAGLMALINAQRGRTTGAGLINAKLYAATGCFRDILSGNNGSYRAGANWDACTGMGTPIGTKLLPKL